MQSCMNSTPQSIRENDGIKSMRMVMVYCKISIVNYKMEEQLEQLKIMNEKPFLQFLNCFFYFILLFIF